MPLIYGPTEMTNPQPKNFVTPSRTTGVYVQNVSPLALIITSSLGSIELPPWQTATLEMMPNDNMNVSAIPITAVPPTLAMYAYVDISYTFQGVTVQGSGLFFPFMTPGGDAVAAGIMGPDGLQVGTSTSNPNNSSLLTQLTGSSATDSLVTYNQTLTTPSGGKTAITILPPTGQRWRIRHLYMYVPPITGATTGTQTIELYVANVSSGRILSATNSYNQSVQIENVIVVGPTSPIPSTAEAQIAAVTRPHFNSSIPLLVQHVNNTDVAANAAFAMRVEWEVGFLD